MWIIFKLIAAGIAFCVRWYLNKRDVYIGSESVQTIDNTEFIVRIYKHKSKIIGTEFCMKPSLRSLFKLTKESSADKLFKSWGFSAEIQTGDYHFDDKVYVASDNPHFNQSLKADQNIRDLSLEILKGADYIQNNSQRFSVRFAGDITHNEHLKTKLVKLFNQLKTIDQKPRSFFRDSFTYKILIIECLIWFLASYSYVSAFHWYMERNITTYLNEMSVIKYGLAFGLVLFLALFFAIAKFLYQSARAHRVIVESFIVLLISFPIGGIALFSDLNIQLDRSVPDTVDARVADSYSLRHRRNRGGHYYTYHLSLAPESSWKYQLPENIKVSSNVFSSIKSGDLVQLSLKPGKFRIPWIEKIAPK